jgi:hypothetical protein
MICINHGGAFQCARRLLVAILACQLAACAPNTPVTSSWFTLQDWRRDIAAEVIAQYGPFPVDSELTHSNVFSMARLLQIRNAMPEIVSGGFIREGDGPFIPWSVVAIAAQPYVDQGRSALPCLVAGLNSPREAVRAGCYFALVAITGEELFFKYELPPGAAVNRPTIAAWEEEAASVSEEHATSNPRFDTETNNAAD